MKNEIITEYIVPKRIVASQGCENSQLMLEERPRQVVLFGEEENLVIHKGGWIILDFGAELQGGVVVTIPDVADNTNIRIVFGESVSEAMSSIGEKNATNNHAIRDVVMPITCWQTFRFGNTGFRFVKLEAVDNDINVVGVQAAFDHRDIEYKGSFECDDELINKIWNVGAYTVFLNMQDCLWDGIKRDRLVWVGDMHPEVSTILSVFGDNNVVRKSLDFISKYTPADKWMNTIPSYNFWWLKIRLDYYMWTGDKEYIVNQREYIEKMSENILLHINPDGSHTFDNMFTDWHSRDTEFEKAGFQAILKIALDSAAELLKMVGNTELSKMCADASQKVKTVIHPYSGSKQVSGMLSLAEMVDAKEISEKVIKPDGEKGLSTFWGYYTIQALGKSGDTASALEIIRKFWGKMIELGATTFWEDFDIDWTENAAGIDEIVPEGKMDIHGDFGKYCYEGFRHSLCHGWASGPTAFLSRYVLGIVIEEAGCKKVSIKPQLGGLKWARGKFPTPYGEIEVEHTLIDGEVVTKVLAPKEIEINILK